MNSNEKWEGLTLRQTGDGSYTLDIPGMKESYHSIHGAVQESFHVFIEMGLKYFKDLSAVRIFEVGFGTGLNALTTLASTQQKIEYLGIEAYPVPVDLALRMNYTEHTDLKAFGDAFHQMHKCQWEEWIEVSPLFTLKKIAQKLEDYQVDLGTFDLVYFDAFAPRAQSEMWEPAQLKKAVDALRAGGALVTYCSQGQFRRHLQSLGMEITKLVGPPGKRDMVRAIKK